MPQEQIFLNTSKSGIFSTPLTSLTPAQDLPPMNVSAQIMHGIKFISQIYSYLNELHIPQEFALEDWSELLQNMHKFISVR